MSVMSSKTWKPWVTSSLERRFQEEGCSHQASSYIIDHLLCWRRDPQQGGGHLSLFLTNQSAWELGSAGYYQSPRDCLRPLDSSSSLTVLKEISTNRRMPTKISGVPKLNWPTSWKGFRFQDKQIDFKCTNTGINNRELPYFYTFLLKLNFTITRHCRSTNWFLYSLWRCICYRLLMLSI